MLRSTARIVSRMGGTRISISKSYTVDKKENPGISPVRMPAWLHKTATCGISTLWLLMMYYVYCIRIICIFLYLWGSAKSICHCGKQNPRQGLFGAPMFWCRTRRYCRLVFTGPKLLCPSHGHWYLVSRHALFKRIRKICSCSVRQHLLLHPSRIHSQGRQGGDWWKSSVTFLHSKNQAWWWCAQQSLPNQASWKLDKAQAKLHVRLQKQAPRCLNIHARCGTKTCCCTEMCTTLAKYVACLTHRNGCLEDSHLVHHTLLWSARRLPHSHESILTCCRHPCTREQLHYHPWFFWPTVFRFLSTA